MGRAWFCREAMMLLAVESGPVIWTNRKEVAFELINVFILLLTINVFIYSIFMPQSDSKLLFSPIYNPNPNPKP